MRILDTRTTFLYLIYAYQITLTSKTVLVAVSSDAGFTPFRRVLHHNTEMFSSGKSINSSLDRLLRTINQEDKHAGQGAVKYFRKKKTAS